MERDFLGDLADSLKKAGGCRDHPELRRSLSVEDAATWHALIALCSPSARHEHERWFSLNDLFYFLIYILNRTHLVGKSKAQQDWADRYKKRIAKWSFERCAEVQEAPDGYMDIWPRESGKSEIITFGKTIQDILIDPNETFGIFSHTRPMAKQFLRQISGELSHNDHLKSLFPDVLWQNPKYEAPKWAEDDGLVVKRGSNRKESTIEAWGLVDGQPTSKRFTKMVFDDVVSRDKVSDDMIVKTTGEFENALLLTASDPPVYRYVATYQEPGDTTEQIEQRRILKARKRGPFDEDGFCAYMSDEKFQMMRERLSPKVFSLQILLDPVKAQAEEHIGFETDWLHYYKEEPTIRSMNVYLLVDPAGKSKESNSRFAMWAVGLLPPKNIYLLDAVLDKFDLAQRGRAVIEMHRKFYAMGKAPLKVGYESFGMQADIEYLREMMQREAYVFTVIQLSGTGQSKDQRIEMLIPDFRAGNVWLPAKGIPYKTVGGEEIDIVRFFVEHEYQLWPFRTKQKDLLDSLARIKDPTMGVVWPRIYGSAETKIGDPWTEGVTGGSGGWLSG